MTTLNTALTTTVNTTETKTVQHLVANNPVSRKIQMRRLNHLLGKVGKALALSSMVHTK
ncbi:hypothetical protein [Rheinheimera salexigens]|uniref:hypothetical protein n=1 Tax=Rheinheimera salexigens TaxID=1628148 RepID=UPI00130136DB|nr:hypothetical protein [Rheinheimera salexigens]